MEKIWEPLIETINKERAIIQKEIAKFYPLYKNEWARSNNEKPVSLKEFLKRITPDSLNINYNYRKQLAWEIFFDDDNLFGRHSIIIGGTFTNNNTKIIINPKHSNLGG